MVNIFSVMNSEENHPTDTIKSKQRLEGNFHLDPRDPTHTFSPPPTRAPSFQNGRVLLQTSQIASSQIRQCHQRSLHCQPLVLGVKSKRKSAAHKDFSILLRKCHSAARPIFLLKSICKTHQLGIPLSQNNFNIITPIPILTMELYTSSQIHLGLMRFFKMPVLPQSQQKQSIPPIFKTTIIKHDDQAL